MRSAAAEQDWLAMVDRYSGYAWTSRLSSMTRHMLSQLETWFTDFGWPLIIRSDNRPQFRSKFTFFCKAHGITHELSSPYNPESNGLAEDGTSPAQLFFGRRLVDHLHQTCIANRDTHTAIMDNFAIGDRVWMQHHTTKKGYQTAVVIKI